MNRTEVLTRGSGFPSLELALGVSVRLLATGAQGAQGLTPALAHFQPAAIRIGGPEDVGDAEQPS